MNLPVEILYQYEYVVQLERLNNGTITAGLRKVSAYQCKIRYNSFHLTAKISLKVNLFMCVKPIAAMFINERNMVGGSEQRKVTGDNNLYLILYLKLFSIIWY